MDTCPPDADDGCGRSVKADLPLAAPEGTISVFETGAGREL